MEGEGGQGAEEDFYTCLLASMKWMVRDMKTGEDIRKNMYCSTMGCCAIRPKLLTFPLSSTLLAAGTDCFSMRAHVR